MKTLDIHKQCVPGPRPIARRGPGVRMREGGRYLLAQKLFCGCCAASDKLIMAIIEWLCALSYSVLGDFFFGGGGVGR